MVLGAQPHSPGQLSARAAGLSPPPRLPWPLEQRLSSPPTWGQTPRHPEFSPRPVSLPSRCVLGNTTILAEFASEEEISRFFAQSQSLTPSPGWQSLGSSQSRLGSLDCSHSFSSRTDLNHWNGAGLSGTSCGDLHGTSLWGAPHYSTSLWGPPSSSDPRGMSSPSPINAFLSVDHLGGGGESM